MRILNILNLALLVAIVSFALASLLGLDFIGVAMMLALFVMPIFQVLAGFIWLVGFNGLNNSYQIKRYFLAVLIYLFTLFTAQYWWDAAETLPILIKIIEVILVATPIILAIYFTVILFRAAKNSSFMKAEWNDLIFINYEINPRTIEKYVPKGTEIDLFNGKCNISLIGFMFEDVKILGMKIPYHVNFEEVNLRFYVRRFEDGIWKRGVVFVKEIVPKHAITFVANTLYNEQYQTLPMRHERKIDGENMIFKYEWKKNDVWNSISVQTEKTLIPIEEHSEAEFISEHYYGYSISPRKKTVEYEVKHPKWHQYQVIDYALDVDFKTTYGEEFAFLQNLQPASCFVAKGSKISIESKKILR